MGQIAESSIESADRGVPPLGARSPMELGWGRDAKNSTRFTPNYLSGGGLMEGEGGVNRCLNGCSLRAGRLFRAEQAFREFVALVRHTRNRCGSDASPLAERSCERAT